MQKRLNPFKYIQITSKEGYIDNPIYTSVKQIKEEHKKVARRKVGLLEEAINFKDRSRNKEFSNKSCKEYWSKFKKDNVCFMINR